jgi:hypothetical protein
MRFLSRPEISLQVVSCGFYFTVFIVAREHLAENERILQTVMIPLPNRNVPYGRHAENCIFEVA